MAEVELRGVKKAFGRHEVLHGVHCTVESSEFIVVLGPSGCGKSTLLRLIAGLEEISSGRIVIDGLIVNDVEPKDRDIAMVFQNYALYPHMSVFNNMAYGLRMRRMPKREIDARVREVAGNLQLDEFLGRKPHQLSGGQRQRVAMGRAIVRQPKVFLFDEPLSNLDAKLRVEMRIEIRRLHNKLGATSIFVTHDQVEAMTLADRLIVMNAGMVEQIGSPLDVYNVPATVFVAGFIGSPAMNFFEADLDPEGRQVILSGGHKFNLGNITYPNFGDRRVILGIRPEHCRLSTSQQADNLRLKTELVEELGSEALVYGRVDGERFIVRLPMQGAVREGDSITVGVDPSSLHLFDVDTGKRLPSAIHNDADATVSDE